MRKVVFVLVVLALTLTAPSAVVAQSVIDNLSADLQLLFSELGKEVVPNLQTASVMNHELGSAQLGEFPRMYFSLSAGSTLDTSGVLLFTKPKFSDRYENYGLFNNLFDEMGLNDSSTRDITDNYLPMPSLRAGIGIGLVQDMELSLQIGVIPQAAADAAFGMAGSDDLEDVTASITTVGTRLRRVIVRQDRGVPAVSAGIGYVYSAIDFGYPLDTLDPLDIGGEGEDKQSLAVDGEMIFKTVTHSFGLDVRASQQFARVFFPFVGMSAYFQVSDYEAGVKDFGGEIISGEEPQRGTGTAVTPAIQPFSEQEYRDFNVVLNTGVDVKMAILNIFLHGNYAFSTRAPGAIVGVRFQF